MGLKVIQANLQHKKAATSNLARKFKAEDFDVALIQEPWVVKGRVAGLAECGGKLLYCSNQEQVPRTCMLVSKRVSLLTMFKFCYRDLVAAKIRVGPREIIIGSAYFPFDSTKPPPTEEVMELVSVAKRTDTHLVLGCDANAHNTVWGSTDCNHRGECLLEYIFSQNLEIANLGSYPTFITSVRREVLDITISTQHIARSILNWRVLREPSLADHQHIVFEIDSDKTQIDRYRNPRKTNWNNYREDLEGLLGPNERSIKNHEDLEKAADEFRDAVTKSYERNCTPITKTSNRKTRWWSEELNVLRMRIRSTFKSALRSQTWDNYRSLLTEYHKAIRKAKRNSWRRYCEEVTVTSEAARLYKSLKASHSNPLGTLERSDGSHTETGKETLDILLSSHFPDSRATESVTSLDSPVWRARRGDWNCAKRLIEYSNVKWAVNSFKAIKAPGPDGIFPLLLQEGLEILAPHLVSLFQSSLALGHVPTAWASAKVTFLPKPGKPDYGQAKAYRPICLTSFILKAMEKILDKYIRKIVQENQALHPNQYAYRPGRSTEAALHQVVSKVEESLELKEIALAAFLDVEGAFSNTSYKSMVGAIEGAGCSKTVCRWVKSLLHNRKITASLFGETVELQTTRGCAQGGVLSPLLWNLVIDKLITELNLGGFFTQGYADDLVIIVQGKFHNIVIDRMQQALRLVEEWCIKENLRVNPGKTTLVPFTKKRGVDGWRPPKLFNKELIWENEVKYLGVTLDRKLTWNSHIDKTITRAKNCMYACKRMVGKTWGMNSKTMLWIYITVVRTVITYACVVWWPKACQTTVRAKLDSVQRLACLAITGAMSTTPADALNIVLDLPPLTDYIKGQARLSSYRLEQTGCWKRKYENLGHAGIDKVVKERELLMPSDYLIPTYNFHQNFQTYITSRNIWHEKQWKFKKNDVIWYTDGSKTDEGTGAGINGVKPEKSISISLGNHCTVFQSEVIAITECLRENVNMQHSGKSIHIFTDSQAAIKAIEAYKTKSKVVWECKQLLNQLSGKNKVKLIWVPGHAGIEGNERADELARGASDTLFIGPEPSCGISYGHARTVIDKWVRNSTIAYWRNTPESRQCKKYITSPSKKLARDILSLNRKELRGVIGLLTGHCPLKKHLQRIGVLNFAADVKPLKK